MEDFFNNRKAQPKYEWCISGLWGRWTEKRKSKYEKAYDVRDFLYHINK